MPGDRIKMSVELICRCAMEQGLRFASAKAAAPSVPASFSKIHD
jgi:translation elongation factor EF-Tu-like GTPase